MNLDTAPDIETSSDAYARRFAGNAGSMFLARQEELVMQALADQGPVTILDVGGGHGQLSGPLAACGHQVTVLGSAPECAARLSQDKRNAGVTFATGPLDRLPFEDRSFDTVVSIRTMAHVEDWQNFLGELCRVASRSVVIDYPELASSNMLSLATFGLKKRIEGDTRVYRSFRSSTLRQAFAASSFLVTSVDREFLLPMALHRAGKGAAPLRAIERVGRAMGVTRFAGNPGIMRADRR
ncbi:class I SAM-dependent methyltransferase [Sphingomonas aerophila]|uniref:Ubiquinone/menaquinone biosynthesis C-methylase UbiE n=1 Tax=Sphingomonas aerophila TaxID=1344948 RepID=A0A7W9BGL0_9SPHN|nr:class I SAM-dependent methyltransferase [Sphingomonas aerophila]MBB5716865.1 ubiquinone/menaquinone biosynthesis C-methylase UbiE [Sphingomonas aerophila]